MLHIVMASTKKEKDRSQRALQKITQRIVCWKVLRNGPEPDFWRHNTFFGGPLWCFETFLTRCNERFAQNWFPSGRRNLSTLYWSIDFFHHVIPQCIWVSKSFWINGLNNKVCIEVIRNSWKPMPIEASPERAFQILKTQIKSENVIELYVHVRT